MKKVLLPILTLVLLLGLASPVAANGGEDNDVLTVTKTLDCSDDLGNDDGIIDLGEVWDFGLLITVTNNSSDDTIYGVVVKDRLGAELMLSPNYIPNPLWVGGTGPVGFYTKGNSDKLFMTWTVGDIPPLTSYTMKFVVSTDINPGGHQEYTSPGTYCLNSGVVAKGRVEWIDAKGRSRSRQVSAESDTICITVPVPPPIP